MDMTKKKCGRITLIFYFLKIHRVKYMEFVTMYSNGVYHEEFTVETKRALRIFSEPQNRRKCIHV